MLAPLLLLAFTVGVGPVGAQSPQPAHMALPPPPEPPPSEQTLPSFTPAPVPNSDMQRPPSTADTGPSAQLTPNLQTHRAHYPGQGFIEGSAAAYDPDHRYHPSPGLRLSVPLQ
jgi:hypothetical protein